MRGIPKLVMASKISSWKRENPSACRQGYFEVHMPTGYKHDYYNRDYNLYRFALSDSPI